MSFHNHIEQKRLRRAERADRKAKSARRIPYGGVVVHSKMVLGHRYLASKGLDFSPGVAAVLLPRTRDQKEIALLM
jgi:hypothetical protein